MLKKVLKETVHPEPKQEETQVAEPEEPQLPEGVKERTSEEFDKLKAKLRDERSRRLYLENVYQQIQQPQQRVEVPPQLYDPATGLLNEKAFTDLQAQTQDARISTF